MDKTFTFDCTLINNDIDILDEYDQHLIINFSKIVNGFEGSIEEAEKSFTNYVNTNLGQNYYLYKYDNNFELLNGHIKVCEIYGNEKEIDYERD